MDRWTEQHLWDAVLSNTKIVVSTYQILLDALTHAFIRMESLALIIFDEGAFPPDFNFPSLRSDNQKRIIVLASRLARN